MSSRLHNASNQVRRGIWAGGTLLGCLGDSSERQLLAEIQEFRRSLPQRYESLPLPEFLVSITPKAADLQQQDTDRLRAMVDAVAWMDRRSEFGLCLRRSMMRYHFLRRANLPLAIQFGARVRQQHESPGVAGHAWNVLNSEPYYEREEDYQGFSVIFEWPEQEQVQIS